MAAAAGRQTRVVAALKQSLQGTEGEKQHKQNSEGTPHLT